MTINYDYKLQGLLIDVDEDELKRIAVDLCTEFNSTDLLDKQINHITYQKKYERSPNDNSKNILLFTLYSIFSFSSFIVLALGMYKLYEIIRDLIY